MDRFCVIARYYALCNAVGAYSTDGLFHLGHAPIFDQPDMNFVINYSRLGMYWLLIAIGTGVFIVYFKDEDK